MSRTEAVEVLRAYGSDAEAGGRAAKEDWKSGRWPLFRDTDFAGLLGGVLGPARGKVWEEGYRRMIDALCVVDAEKARRDLERAAAKEDWSRRLQSLLKPSIYQAIKEIADSRGRSVNNLLEMILIDFIAKENETKQAMNTMNTMNTEENNCIDEYRRANIKRDIERKLRAEWNFDICHKAYTATEQLLTYTDTTLRGMEHDDPDYMIYRNAHADLHDLYTIERENLRRATEELEDAKNALANWGKDAAIIEAEEAGKAGDHGQE